jgi:hypothetical protein
MAWPSPRLMSPHGAETVKWPACEAQRNIDKLIAESLANVDNWHFTTDELMMMLEVLGVRISRSAFWQPNRPRRRGHR